jgi:hypothetical protein
VGGVQAGAGYVAAGVDGGAVMTEPGLLAGGWMTAADAAQLLPAGSLMLFTLMFHIGP